MSDQTRREVKEVSEPSAESIQPQNQPDAGGATVAIYGRQVVMTRIMDVPVIYSNITSTSFGPEELLLTFGMRDLQDANRAVARITIAMNVGEAKRTVMMLSSLIQQMETLFGEINPDPFSRLTDAGRAFVEAQKVNV